MDIREFLDAWEKGTRITITAQTPKQRFWESKKARRKKMN